MGKDIIKFGDNGIENIKENLNFINKRHILMDDINVNKIIVPNKVAFGKKDFRYFISYKNGRKVRLLCIILPKMSAWRRDFHERKYVSLLIEDDGLLKKM